MQRARSCRSNHGDASSKNQASPQHVEIPTINSRCRRHCSIGSDLSTSRSTSASRYLSSSFHFLPRKSNTVLQRVISIGLLRLTSYTHVDSLDTEPLAKSYSGTIFRNSSLSKSPLDSCNGFLCVYFYSRRRQVSRLRPFFRRGTAPSHPSQQKY